MSQGTGTQFNNGSGKLFGGVKYPILRRGSDDDPPLHTPQCSQSGTSYAFKALEYFSGPWGKYFNIMAVHKNWIISNCK